MRFSGLFKTSILVRLMAKILRVYCRLEEQLSIVCRNSRTYRLTGAAWKGVTASFKYSFLGKICEVGNLYKTETLCSSMVVRQMSRVLRGLRDNVTVYLKKSMLIDMAQEMKNALFLLPIKIGSLAIIITVLTNIFLSILLRKEIGLLGWVIRLSSLAVGLCALSCNVDWRDVKETSFVLRQINNHCKIQD